MIPIFPNFKKLELNDKKEIEKITGKFPPYSDYNFVSLWSYNTEDDILLSLLHKNIVIRFRDYVTNEPFYSFLGNGDPVSTIRDLLLYALKTNILNVLKLIPEHNIINTPDVFSEFKVEEDRDNFDYMYLTEELSRLEGAKYGKKRNKLSVLRREHPNVRARLIELTNKETHKDILEIFYIWEKNKGRDREETGHELIAIQRLLKAVDLLPVVCVGIYDDVNFKGFSITEVLPNSYSIFHFVKADPEYTGIFEFLYTSTFQELYKRGYKYVSREQDLGIPGLREAKKSYHPNSFLKKFIITAKQ